MKAINLGIGSDLMDSVGIIEADREDLVLSKCISCATNIAKMLPVYEITFLPTWIFQPEVAIFVYLHNFSNFGIRKSPIIGRTVCRAFASVAMQMSNLLTNFRHSSCAMQELHFSRTLLAWRCFTFVAE